MVNGIINLIKACLKITVIKIDIFPSPSSSTQSSRFGVFWDKMKGEARIVIGTLLGIFQNH